MVEPYASLIHTVCAAIAAPSGIGKLLPLDFARRKIPLKALGLKQYLSRCGPVSKHADNEHAAASLGHSEELRVEYTPRQTVPEFIHFIEELSESLPSSLENAPGTFSQTK